ncbi:MarR family protein [Friedmanniella luteola]|uniref:MarR family protein n=1 Tax=Friedmanniella luteola TaxID=546871 RepID=A0A1H2A1B2_9ACTN|nr:MarR family transcriptional regulator [Friedmanniella luteola]SDT39607.1 MarR family protein [Friedmanniella luteola]
MEPDEVFAHRVRLLGGLRSFGASYTELTQEFALSLGLRSTDAGAVVEILYAEDLGVPLTPARLAERIGLTSGATAQLLNRLEVAGHITRTRELTDRRKVTLRTSPDIVPPARAFFATLGSHLDRLVARHDTAELALVATFLDELSHTMAAAIEESRVRPQPGGRGAGSGPDRSR